MKTYKLINNITGWLMFAIAAFTYCSTVEPTASFWDCPEFISTAAKLEVGHPPGAPFFMLLGNFFSLFASDASQIALMVNTMSALLSAGCILFLFWSVTHLAKALLCEKNGEPTMAQTVAIMASGIAGALIYTWSDTFWFSAVEGEVYAFSSFFTALVFWLILKWEDNADNPGSDKWLVFIAYLVGLSIGVHLLNLLCIPAIVLVFYYKKCKNPTALGSLAMLVVSAALIVAVLYGVVPGIVKVGGAFELLFVNEMHFAFNTGLYIYLALLAAVLVWAIIETVNNRNRVRMNLSFLASVALLGIPFYDHGWTSVLIGIVVLAVLGAVLFMRKEINARILNTAVLCMALITIGYSSYAVIVIRSTANPPMDQNSPEDVFTLGEYLGREQYGERPLFWGETYASRPEVIRNAEGDLVYNIKKGAPVYQRHEKEDANEPDSYEVIRERMGFIYPSNQCMIFPRIYSDDHRSDYIQWLGSEPSKPVIYTIPGNGSQEVMLPTFGDNLRFFWTYQMNFMYWRYFMWNFAGRQNDIQGHGELEHGNWVTGISFLDDLRLGDQSQLPSDLQNNKGHNVFFCLPLILGLLGFFWQAFRGQKGIQQFWVVFFLFFMTGIAIVLYLNQTPVQPRERDYAYAGSFYAFAIWCGLGIAAIYEMLCKMVKVEQDEKNTKTLAFAIVSLVPAVLVPLQMVSQTWDDHDRSNRYVCRDFGLNYLETVPHDGVIFTNGDNDTFPLWYNEDTEGKRTDVRVCNLSYLQTDWYIDQMKRPAFEGKGMSSPLPISWNRLQYVSGKNEMIDVNPQVTADLKMEDVVKGIYAENPELAKAIWGDDPFELSVAIRRFVLKADIPEQFKEMVAELPSCLPSDTLHITVDKEAVRRSGMMIPNDSIPDQLVISLKGQGRVSKSFTMMLEMLAQSNFSRPLYMSTTVGASNYGSLYKHFVQEGIAWRFTPFTFDNNQPMNTVVDTDKMYDNMMNKYKYGNLSHPDLYIDETTMRMCYTHRRWFANLISTLVMQGDKERALKALEKCDKEIPDYNVPHDAGSGSLELVSAYVACGKYDKADAILKALTQKCDEYYTWYMSLSDNRFKQSTRDCYQQVSILASIVSTYERMSEMNKSFTQTYEKLSEELDSRYNNFINRCESAGVELR